MKWIVDGYEYNELSESVSAVIESIDTNRFDEYLDKIYGEFDVCGYNCTAAETLKAVDPTTYRRKFNEWKGSLSDDIEGELEDMSNGDATNLYGVDVSAEEAKEEKRNEL